MEKVSRKVLHEGIKAKYYDTVADALRAQDLEVLRVGSAEMAIPVLDAEQNEEWLVITLKVPTGARTEVKGVTEAYDGYAMAQDYEMRQTAKAEKAKAAAEAKALKIERDAKARAERKAAREAARKEKEGE